MLPTPLYLHILTINTAPFVPMYSDVKVHLPWKRWIEVATKNKLCIMNWAKGIPPPGPNFEIRKLSASCLRTITKSFIENTLAGKSECEVFSVISWSNGVWFSCCYINTVLRFWQSSVPFLTLIQERDSFPLS